MRNWSKMFAATLFCVCLLIVYTADAYSQPATAIGTGTDVYANSGGGESYAIDDDAKKNQLRRSNESYAPETPAGPADTVDETPFNPEAPARDGIFDKISTKEKIPLAYDHIREADVFWQKRVWRVVDTRQKMNHYFMQPEQPLIQVFLDIIEQNPGIGIYMDDKFKEGLSRADLESSLGTQDTIEKIDLDTYETVKVVVNNELDWTAVTKFRIKEDWVFDEESSRMVVRILGIAPIMEVYDENDNYRGQKALFWAYYPDFRKHLAHYETFNPHNDAIRMTWDDAFEMRMFSSFIMKESNMQDRRIKDYATGKDALFESERIKEEIFLKEHDLWSY